MTSVKRTAQQAVQEQLSCPLCLEQYIEPLVLDCLHTYCTLCLQEYASQLSAGPGQPLSCPVCRSKSTIPPGGVGNFRSNFMVKGLVEALGHVTLEDQDGPEDEGCDMCDTRGSSCIQAECLTCPGKMCSQCTHAHRTMKNFKDHDVIMIQRKEAPIQAPVTQTPPHKTSATTPDEVSISREKGVGAGGGDKVDSCSAGSEEPDCPWCKPGMEPPHPGPGHHRRLWRWHRRFHGPHLPDSRPNPHFPGEGDPGACLPPHCGWMWHHRGRGGHRGPGHPGPHPGPPGPHGGRHGGCRGRWGRGRRRFWMEAMQKFE